ncbi:hypothetical protein KAU05_00860 [Candidatus Aerophobetes bacterium]|nr:hypothetical protein [Candidatus Aerophobetes bacterium]
MKKGLWVKGVVLSIIMVVMLTGNVFAQEDQEKILKLKDQIIQIQNKGKLGMRNLNLCSKVITLGAYLPLPEAKIKVEKEYYIYYEPTNWFTKIEGGRYEFWFTQDAFLLDAKGEVLVERLGALSMHFNTTTPLLDIYVVNDLHITGAPPGKYTYKIVLRDEFNDETVTKTVDFEVVE